MNQLECEDSSKQKNYESPLRSNSFLAVRMEMKGPELLLSTFTKPCFTNIKGRETIGRLTKSLEVLESDNRSNKP